MSLSEAQQIYQTCIQIDALLDKIESKMSKTEEKTARVIFYKDDLREIEYIFYRVTSLMARMGLPPEIDRAISQLQRLIVTIRALTMTMHYFQMATPAGWVLGLLGVISSALTVESMISSYNP